jgi:hypothetical protein
MGYWWGTQKERDRLEDQDVGGWITLIWIWEWYDRLVPTGLVCRRIGTGGRLLWMWKWTFGLYKMLRNFRVAASWVVLSSTELDQLLVLWEMYYLSFALTDFDLYDRLFGLLDRVPDYRSRGSDSIPWATIFSEKYWGWNWVHSASWR